MELVLISPEGEDARETALLPRLFAAGLSRYHLRKPGWSAGRMAEFIAAIPAEFRARLVPHAHHELTGQFGLGGRHWTELAVAGVAAPGGRPSSTSLTSRSCHDLPALAAALGEYDSVFFGPVFPSLSKPGRVPAVDLDLAAVSRRLRQPGRARRRTNVLALGGITAERVAACRDLGFDGVATLGAVWGAADPAEAFERLRDACRAAARLPIRRLPALMCLTQDGLDLSHREQTERLCAAGARWVQVRMKSADDGERRRVARECVRVCRDHDAICVVNDRIDVALEAGADGAHLGRQDGDWREARRALGPAALLGGTVNDAADAERAVAAESLDYAGVGPLRFTATKAKLAPVLGLDGIRRLTGLLRGIPAWAIGGATADDVAGVVGAGAAGLAVSSALYEGRRIEQNVRRFADEFNRHLSSS